MGIFSLFSAKPKKFFTASENLQIVDAIRKAETATSGEIRIFVESRNRFVDPIDRAKEIFFKLKMQNTAHRNAVLLYIAMEHRQLALYADEGIYQATGAGYWQNAVAQMLENFRGKHITNGITECILQIGQTLQEKFPYEASTDKNELPDEIVFGK